MHMVGTTVILVAEVPPTFPRRCPQYVHRALHRPWGAVHKLPTAPSTVVS